MGKKLERKDAGSGLGVRPVSVASPRAGFDPAIRGDPGRDSPALSTAVAQDLGHSFADLSAANGAGLHPPVQRAKYPSSWSDEDIGGITNFTGDQAGEKGNEEKKTARVKGETLALTDYFGAVDFNCYAWAMGETSFEDPGSKLGTWKHRLGKKYTFVPPNDGSAKILLWGNKSKKSEDDHEVLHASVLLSHSELLARVSGDFDKIDVDKTSIKKIADDPFWSSALGFGFGVMVHPKDFFEGGDFGTVVAGMK